MSDPFKDMDPELLKRANDPDAELEDAEVDALLYRAHRPGFLLAKTYDEIRFPGCWLGGEPTLPPDINWPMTLSDEGEPLAPMHFLGQFNFSHMPGLLSIEKAPKKGTLFFFVDCLMGTQSCKVIYIENDVLIFPFCTMPSIATEPESLWCIDHALNGFTKSGIEFWAFDGVDPFFIPNQDYWINAANICRNIKDGLQKQTSDLRPDSESFACHQFYGGLGESYESENHLRLFTFEKDPHLGFIPDDSSGIVFWLSKQAFSVGNFDDCKIDLEVAL